MERKERKGGQAGCAAGSGHMGAKQVRVEKKENTRGKMRERERSDKMKERERE